MHVTRIALVAGLLASFCFTSAVASDGTWQRISDSPQPTVFGDGYVLDLGPLQPPVPTIPGYTVTPFAGIQRPRGVSFNAAGDLFTMDRDSGTIFRITPDGAVSVVADLPDILAGYVGPLFDPVSGNLFVSRFAVYTGNEVLRITPAGNVDVYATGILPPGGLTSDPAGNLYVSQFEDGGQVFKITPAREVSPFASGLYYPDGLVFGPTGDLFICNTRLNEIRRVPPTGGTAALFASGFNYPIAATFDNAGNLLVAEYLGGSIAKVSPTGTVSPFGSGFISPAGLAFDDQGDLFIADFGANMIYKAVPGAVGQPIPALFLGRTSGLPGDTVLMPLRLRPPHGLAALDATITWNPALAQCIEVHKTPATDSFLLESNLTVQGEAQVAMVSREPIPRGAADELLVFSFVIEDTVSRGTTIELNIREPHLFDPNGDHIGVVLFYPSGEIFVGNPPGDVDGDGRVTIADVILTLQIVVGTHTPTEIERMAADVNHDGEINSADAVIILHMVTTEAATRPPVDSSAAVSFVAPQVAYNPSDQTVRLTLFGELLTDVAGGKLHVQFDPTLVALQQTAAGRDVGQTLNEFASDAANVRFAFAKSSNLTLAVGELAQVQWRALQSLTLEQLNRAVRVVGTEFYGENGQSIPVAVRLSGPTGVTNQNGTVPKSYALRQNVPNPFNARTAIHFSLPQPGEVALEIFNVAAQKVRTLVNAHYPAGEQVIFWDGRDDQGEELASGLYFYRLTAGSFSDTRKMVLVK